MEKVKTIQYDIPYTYENSSNPWLMGSKDSKIKDKRIITINGNKITSEYMWSLNSLGKNIQDIVVEYYRDKGFPAETYDDKFLIDSFKKLEKADQYKVIDANGYVSNFGQLCLPVCRHFCADKFWKASSESMSSIEDVFYNDDLFIKVLKNRMGWNVTTEGGEVRPYMFTLSDSMIRCGIRNSGYGYGVSNFRPIIAKYIYNKYLAGEISPTVYDFSAGWGARCLAAMSLRYNYIGVDPLTSDNINDMIKFYKNSKELYIPGSHICYNVCSQDEVLYELLPDNIDLAFSCPPYFNLEVYSKDATQSYNQYSNYNDWLEYYWRPTIKICHNKLKDAGKLVFIIKDRYGKLDLKEGMEKIILKKDLSLLNLFNIRHL